MTADLVAFLRARLDEDEHVARSVEDRGAPWDGQWVADGDDAARTFNGHVLFYGHNGPLKAGLVEHVTRHDPARVVREVEAKRRLLYQFEHRGNSVRAVVTPPTGGVWDDLLRLLALSYADHPDYRQEWRP